MYVYSTAITITHKNEDLATATFISVKDGMNINFICLKVKLCFLKQKCIHWFHLDLFWLICRILIVISNCHILYLHLSLLEDNKSQIFINQRLIYSTCTHTPLTYNIIEMHQSPIQIYLLQITKCLGLLHFIPIFNQGLQYQPQATSK